MFIVVLVVVAGSLFYAVGSNGTLSFTGSSYSPMPMMEPAYDMAYDYEIEEAAVMRSFADEGAVETYNKQSYADGDDAVERMVIKTGSLSLVVDDVSQSVEEIVNYAEGKGGFLVTRNINKYGLELSGFVTVRVPSEYLEEAMTFIKEMGDLESENIDGRDVTEEYTDLDSQLKNLKATEAQFLEIMKKAVEIEDVLAVQRELSYIRGEIEVLEGRMKYIRESVDLSSITVYLSTDPSNLPVVDEDDKWKPLGVLKSAVRALLDTGMAVVNGLIWFGVFIPVIAVALLLVWLLWRFVIKKIWNT